MSTKFVTKGKNAGDNQTQDKTDIQNTDRGKTRLSSNQGKTIKNETQRDCTKSTHSVIQTIENELTDAWQLT